MFVGLKRGCIIISAPKRGIPTCGTNPLLTNLDTPRGVTHPSCRFTMAQFSSLKLDPLLLPSHTGTTSASVQPAWTLPVREPHLHISYFRPPICVECNNSEVQGLF